MNWLLYGGLAAALAYLFLGRKNDPAPAPSPSGPAIPPAPGPTLRKIFLPIVSDQIELHVGDVISIEIVQGGPFPSDPKGWALFASPDVVQPMAAANTFRIVGKTGDVHIAWGEHDTFRAGEVFLRVV